MKKQNKVVKEGNLNSMSVNQLKRLYRKYANELKINKKSIDDNLKYFYYTKTSLISKITNLVERIEKKGKKSKKINLQNKSNNKTRKLNNNRLKTI
jgi:hypothetical protein